MDYPSKFIEDAVNQVSKLPGIGKKTALRLVLHLIRENETFAGSLAESILNLKRHIQYCDQCHNISDSKRCAICSNPNRDQKVLCIVENVNDVMAIENTAQYHGLYHVLGGVISPMRGIGPGELKIESLVHRLNHPGNEVKEIVLALSPNMEGDTTSFYVHKRIKDLPIQVSVIARGIPVGGDLEYADEITLGRSILGRTLFH